MTHNFTTVRSRHLDTGNWAKLYRQIPTSWYSQLGKTLPSDLDSLTHYKFNEQLDKALLSEPDPLIHIIGQSFTVRSWPLDTANSTNNYTKLYRQIPTSWYKQLDKALPSHPKLCRHKFVALFRCHGRSRPPPDAAAISSPNMPCWAGTSVNLWRSYNIW